MRNVPKGKYPSEDDCTCGNWYHDAPCKCTSLKEAVKDPAIAMAKLPKGEREVYDAAEQSVLDARRNPFFGQLKDAPTNPPYIPDWLERFEFHQDADESAEESATGPWIRAEDLPALYAAWEKEELDPLRVELRELEDANRSLAKMRDAALEGNLSTPDHAA